MMVRMSEPNTSSMGHHSPRVCWRTSSRVFLGSRKMLSRLLKTEAEAADGLVAFIGFSPGLDMDACRTPAYPTTIDRSGAPGFGGPLSCDHHRQRAVPPEVTVVTASSD